MRSSKLCAIALCAALSVAALHAQEKAREYVVVSDDNLYEFERAVEDYLTRGYELYGYLTITFNGYYSSSEYRKPVYYQTVIKR